MLMSYLAKQLVICALMVRMVKNVLAAPRGDEITSLPGWNHNIINIQRVSPNLKATDLTISRAIKHKNAKHLD